MKKATILAFAVLVFSLCARADTFSFTITGGAQAAGSFTVGPANFGCVQLHGGDAGILSFTGTFDGSPIEFLNPGLVDNCGSGFMNGPYMQAEGYETGSFLMEDIAGPVFSAGGNLYQLWRDDLCVCDGFEYFLLHPITLTFAAENPLFVTIERTADLPVGVPEPSIPALLLCGLFMLVAAKLARAILA